MDGAQKTHTSLVASEKIPPLLKDQDRWAPWRGVFDAKRGKHDKIPCHPGNVQRGLSTANPHKWVSFKAAYDAHSAARGYTTGIGYVMTNPHGIVGIDLDDAVADGVVDLWAQEIVERVGGYAEFSPSGTGLRIFVLGTIEGDWTNHTVGVEVYAGYHPRFLTVTGRHLPGTPKDVVEPKPGALAWLADTYRETAQEKQAKGEVPDMPMVLAERDTPDIAELGLPPRAHDFLTSGDVGDSGDRSRVLHSTAVALFAAGLNEAEVLSVLVNNPYSFEVALDHRRQIEDKALTYLWQHHVVAAKGKAANKILSASDWEQLEAASATDDGEESPLGKDDEAETRDDLNTEDRIQPSEMPKTKTHYPIFGFHEYADRQVRLEWLVPGVLPKAEICSIFGESGAGKSFFVLSMAVALSAGVHWWGKALVKRRVVYVAAEGAVGVQLRVRAIRTQYQLEDAHVGLFVIPAQPNLLQVEDVKKLISDIKTLGQVDVVIIDTIAQVTPGANENSSEDMGRALAHCKTLHKTLSATIVLVGHSGKNPSAGQRGWSGIKGALDAQIEVTRTATYRAATIAKLKDGKGEGEKYMFKLSEIVVDFEPDSSPITSCVVEPIVTPEAKAAFEAAAAAAKRANSGRPKAQGKWARIVMEALECLCGSTNKPAHAQRLLDKAVELATQHPETNIRDPRGSLRKALASLCEGDANQVIEDRDHSSYTLRVPPVAPVVDA